MATRAPRSPRPSTPSEGSRGAPSEPTLCIDIGGSGLKASVVDSEGTMLHERVRVPVEYPMGPIQLLDRLVELTAPLPPYVRVAVAFPGVVREGRVLTAPNLARKKGPGSPVDDELLAAWTGFDLVGAVSERFAKPVRAINDADMQGLAVATGEGVEMVVTLGTGVGTSILARGVLGPHLELAHHPFRRGETYDEQLGDATRRRVGAKTWNRRVAKAVANFDRLVMFDVLYLGGGNARHVSVDLGPKVTLIEATAGITGGAKLWSQPAP